MNRTPVTLSALIAASVTASLALALSPSLASANSAEIGGPEPSLSANYFYAPFSARPNGTFEFEPEAASGTRDVRPLGTDGVATIGHVRYHFLSVLTAHAFSGYSGTNDDRMERARSAYGAELSLQALNQDDHGISLFLTGGYRRDFWEVSLPTARLTISRDFDALNTTFSAYGEKPINDEKRDKLDLLFTVGVSYAVLPELRVGVEATGEDVEGYWEEDEAEGGAKLLAGPTVAWAVTPQIRLQGNVSGIWPATSNTPKRPEWLDVDYDKRGVIGRLAATFSF